MGRIGIQTLILLRILTQMVFFGKNHLRNKLLSRQKNSYNFYNFDVVDQSDNTFA